MSTDVSIPCLTYSNSGGKGIHSESIQGSAFKKTWNIQNGCLNFVHDKASWKKCSRTCQGEDRCQENVPVDFTLFADVTVGELKKHKHFAHRLFYHPISNQFEYFGESNGTKKHLGFGACRARSPQGCSAISMTMLPFDYITTQRIVSTKICQVWRI